MKILNVIFYLIFLVFEINAQSRIESFESEINTAGEDTGKVKLLMKYARELRERNLIKEDSAKIIELLRKAVELSEDINYETGVSNAYNGLGIYYGYYLHQYPLALEYYQKALNVLSKTGKIELSTGKNYENISLIYEIIGAFPEAIKYNYEALTVYKKLNRTGDESRLHHQLGNIYSHLKEFDKATYNIKKAVSLVRSINDSYLIALYLNDLSGHYLTLYEHAGDIEYTDSALNCLNEAYLLAESGKDWRENKSLITEIMLNTGKAYKFKNNILLAKEYLQKCLQQPDSLQNEYSLCYANGYLGECYFLEGNYAESEKFLQTALVLAQKIKSPYYLLFAYELLYKLHEKKKDYATAFSYHTKYMAVKDSIYDTEKTKAVNNLNIMYETGQKETRIQNLEKENKYSRNVNLFLTALAFFAAVLLASLYFLYKLRRKTFYQKEQIFEKEKLLEEKQKRQLQEELGAQKIISRLKEEQMQQEIDKAALEKELEEKQKQLLRDEIDFKARELTANIMHLEKKNELLINIKNHLQELQAANKNITNEFKNLYKLIDSAAQMDDDFNKFSAHFENVHPQFFERLRQHAASPLTQLDLKLCAFTKMHLSTKEIANLLNVEPRSIRTARYRTKLKFASVKEEDFSDFLTRL